MNKCIACGNTNLDSGMIPTVKRSKYVSDTARSLFKENGIGFKAIACLQCGYIHLECDPEELTKIVNR